ncbi:MAG TPA: hypothetical protein VKA19_10510 [Alphaproteobacteria bacterium]|nr:hypothetical protein [Alphaproteobacteria bacterium]
MAKIEAMDAEDKKWRAESDLRTLIEAEKIKSDNARFNAALSKKAELQKSLDGMTDGKK